MRPSQSCTSGGASPGVRSASRVSPSWIVRGVRSSWPTTRMNALRAQYASVATMNSQLQQSCTLAKTSGVIVYGIAFEAPANGQQQISTCATSPAHYFNAQGLGIQSAFRAIASNLTQLKLTQ